MAITAGGRRPAPYTPPSPADQVTITPTEDGGFAVECLRDGRPTTSTYPDFASTLDYVASELQGPVEEEMAISAEAPAPPPMPMSGEEFGE